MSLSKEIKVRLRDFFYFNFVILIILHFLTYNIYLLKLSYDVDISKLRRKPFMLKMIMFILNLVSIKV